MARKNEPRPEPTKAGPEPPSSSDRKRTPARPTGGAPQPHIEARTEARNHIEWLNKTFSAELSPIQTIRDLTTSPPLKGSYVEAIVRKFIAKTVSPLRVSHGSIIYPENRQAGKLPQIDVIIWSPCPVPAVLEVGDFAIVPRGSAHACLEIKTSYDTGTPKDIRDRLNHAEDSLRIPGFHPYDSPEIARRYALGVVCIDDNGLYRPGNKNNGQLLVLFDKELKPIGANLMKLFNFLRLVRNRARCVESRLGVRTEF